MSAYVSVLKILSLSCSRLGDPSASTRTQASMQLLAFSYRLYRRHQKYISRIYGQKNLDPYFSRFVFHLLDLVHLAYTRSAWAKNRPTCTFILMSIVLKLEKPCMLRLYFRSCCFEHPHSQNGRLRGIIPTSRLCSIER